MQLEAAFHCSVKCHQGQRGDEGCQPDVRDQNGEIDRTHPTLSGEGYRAHLVVVVEVGREKEARGKKGRDHGHLVRADVLPADEKVTGR